MPCPPSPGTVCEELQLSLVQPALQASTACLFGSPTSIVQCLPSLAFKTLCSLVGGGTNDQCMKATEATHRLTWQCIKEPWFDLTGAANRSFGVNSTGKSHKILSTPLAYCYNKKNKTQMHLIFMVWNGHRGQHRKEEVSLDRNRRVQASHSCLRFVRSCRLMFEQSKWYEEQLCEDQHLKVWVPTTPPLFLFSVTKHRARNVTQTCGNACRCSLLSSVNGSEPPLSFQSSRTWPEV